MCCTVYALNSFIFFHSTFFSDALHVRSLSFSHSRTSVCVSIKHLFQFQLTLLLSFANNFDVLFYSMFVLTVCLPHYFPSHICRVCYAILRVYVRLLLLFLFLFHSEVIFHCIHYGRLKLQNNIYRFC